MTAAATPATLADLKGTFVLDASHSQLGFVARHAMVTKVRGTFGSFTGEAVVDGAKDDHALPHLVDKMSIAPFLIANLP